MSKSITAVVFIGIVISGAFAAPHPSVQAGWERDYQQLQDQLLDRDLLYLKGIPKSSAGGGSKILDPNALILDSDRSPVDIAIRRAGALLAHLKSMPGAPDLSDRELELAAIKNRWQGTSLARGGGENVATLRQV